MYNILIWGTGREYNNYFNCIRMLELKEQISIVGVTSNDQNITTSIDDYPFVKKEDINSLNFDYCIVAMANMSLIIDEAASLGIEKSKLIPIRVLSIPNINFNEYIKLKNSSLTILSINCWAGLCYHSLGLEFLSPTINMCESENDFNKIMLNLDTYMSYPVEFVETRKYKNSPNGEYPIGLLNDVLLHFLHYESFDQAVSCWEKRKNRINKDNILVVSLAESEKALYEFENIPYKNKLVFTPLDVNTPSSYHLNLENTGSYGITITKTATGVINLLDFIALCNHEDNYIRIK
ncbi:MAG: DUF1919 domain-containing protein [Acetatifactor sp.]|nr:DUF1919 domain-containing protein [Acetatifactor sp.]